MKEKMHITILSLGVCALIGFTFAVSSKDYKERAPKLDSAPETSVHSQKFVCTEAAVSDSSQATKEYNKNIKKLEEFLDKVDSLGGDTTTLEDPCGGLKGKEKTECNINNVELKGAIRQVKKLEAKIIPYEECIEKLGLLKTDKEISGEADTPKKSEQKEEKTSDKTNKDDNIKTTDKKLKDCGIMKEEAGETVSLESQKKLACISHAITSCTPAKITFKNSEMDDVTYIVYKKNTTSCAIGFSTSEGSSQCDIPLNTIKDIKKYGEEEDMSDFIITPIAMLLMFREGTSTITGEKFSLTCRDYGPDNKKDTAGWSEGEWSTCSNGSQTRKVACLSGGKKVDDKKCARVIQPSTYQKCTDSTDSSNTISSKNEDNRWSEGEWSTCSNGKQTRVVECQLNGKKVDDKQCEGKKPDTTKTCTEGAKNTNVVGKIKDCGEVDNNSFTLDSSPNNQENKNMQCFSENIANCSQSNLKVSSKEDGGYFSVQIHGKKPGICQISVNVEEYRKKCDISLKGISNMVTNIRKDNMPVGTLSILVASMIIYDSDFNANVDREYKISCQEFMNEKLVTSNK